MPLGDPRLYYCHPTVSYQWPHAWYLMDTSNLRRYEVSLEAIPIPSKSSNHGVYYAQCEWVIKQLPPVGISIIFEEAWGRGFLFVYLGFYIAFNTVQVISRWVVLWAEEYILLVSRFCTVNCWPTASNYQLFHLRLCWEPNPDLRGGRRECYHSATVAPWGRGRLHHMW